MSGDDLTTKLRGEKPPEQTSPTDAGDQTTDDRWREYAEYLHEETVLSPRQAEVMALDRFGRTASEMADEFEVGTPTISKHREAIGGKTQQAATLDRLQNPPLTGPGIAPVKVADATVSASTDQTHAFELYVNFAYGAILSEELPPAASARYILVRESTTTSACGSRQTREVSLYTDYDEFVLAGVATRVFPTPQDECARTVAEFGSVIGGRSPDQLLDRRADLYDAIESAYRAVGRGESTIATIAETYGLPQSHVKRNVRELTTTE